MKKYIPILLATSLLLSACSIDWGNKEDMFRKKQECAQYIPKIEEVIKKNTKIYNERLYTHEETFLEIFYSPKQNSCLYTVKVKEVENGETCNFYKIYDYLSASTYPIGTYLKFKINNDAKIIEKCDDFATEENYQEALSEFKWE